MNEIVLFFTLMNSQDVLLTKVYPLFNLFGGKMWKLKKDVSFVDVYPAFIQQEAHD